MRTKQEEVLSTLRSAQQFLDAHADAIGPAIAPARKKLDDAASALAALPATQDGGARGSLGETANLHALRDTLRRDHMAPIAALAHYSLSDIPNFAALKLPNRRISAGRELAAAYAMADVASAHASVFTSDGFAPTFAADLRAAADAVTASLVSRRGHQNRRSGATIELVDGEKQSRAVLRMVNVRVVASIGSNTTLIAEWNAAKRLRQTSGPSKASAPVTGAVTPAPVIVAPSAPKLVAAPVPVPASASTPSTEVHAASVAA